MKTLCMSEVLLIIFTNRHSFKKVAVVSGTAYFGYCGTINALSDAQAIVIGWSAMAFCR